LIVYYSQMGKCSASGTVICDNNTLTRIVVREENQGVRLGAFTTQPKPQQFIRRATVLHSSSPEPNPQKSTHTHVSNPSHLRTHRPYPAGSKVYREAYCVLSQHTKAARRQWPSGHRETTCFHSGAEHHATRYRARRGCRLRVREGITPPALLVPQVRCSLRLRGDVCTSCRNGGEGCSVV
jgi:hypothetical protein